MNLLLIILLVIAAVVYLIGMGRGGRTPPDAGRSLTVGAGTTVSLSFFLAVARLLLAGGVGSAVGLVGYKYLHAVTFSSTVPGIADWASAHDLVPKVFGFLVGLAVAAGIFSSTRRRS